MIEDIALESGVQLGWGKAVMMYSLLSSQNVLNCGRGIGENDRSEKLTNLSGCQYHNQLTRPNSSTSKFPHKVIVLL